jgi:hypothetical protein
MKAEYINYLDIAEYLVSDVVFFFIEWSILEKAQLKK